MLCYASSVGMVNSLKNEDLMNLIDKLDQSSLVYFNYETEDTKLILAKEMPKNQEIQIKSAPETVVADTVQEETLVQEVEEVEIQAIPESISLEGEVVTSPMVGVAYLQANPESDPFIKVGDTVQEGDTILIIEAMKLMNEIQSTKSGIVTEILVDNETVVEFGQPLVRIK